MDRQEAATMFNPLQHQICWTTPAWQLASDWTDQLPFGMLLVDLLRPRLVVEIGATTAVSFFGFCQAVKVLAAGGDRDIATRCWGIGEWSGRTGAAWLRELKAHHDPRYGEFSSLVQSGPELAQPQFQQGTIDLLHLDGCTEGTLAMDRFEHCLPSMSDRGVVLLHDIAVRTPGAGAFNAWEMLSRKYPSFELPHGCGLGVLAVGNRAADAVPMLFRASESERRELQRMFARLGTLTWSESEEHVLRKRMTEAVATAEEAAERVAHSERALARIVAQRDEAIGWLRAEASWARRRAEALAHELETIRKSRAWLWLTRYRGLRHRLGAPVPASRPIPPARPETPASPLMGSAADPAMGLTAAESPALSLGALTLLPNVRIDHAMAVLSATDTAPTPRPHDIICFGIIDWEFRYQRPQQLMSHFAAAGHRVFYVSPSRFSSPGTDNGLVTKEIKERVYEVQLGTRRPPNVYGEIIGGNGDSSLVDSLDELRRRFDIRSAIGYVMIASWSPVALEAGRRWHWPVVYDCMDEWESFPGIKAPILEAERELVRRADLIVVTARRLLDKWRPSGRPLALVRNAVDYDFYRERCVPNPLLADTPHPIVGYYGAIADWFDVDLMLHVAKARPQYHFVLLGGVFDVNVAPLRALRNVSLLGQQPYATMPQYLYHFDACIIPFKVNKITEATDPVKLYEYLSGGKPVVSVKLAEVEEFGEYLYLAADREDFVTKLDAAVNERDPAMVERRKQFAATHTWASRCEAIDRALADAPVAASIIVVTFNNVALTKLCLESVLRNTHVFNFEIIVVDNASSDETPEYLSRMAAAHSRIRIILNQKNLGFPAANNQGLAASRGAHLVLLNNDTIVPPGWLERLLEHLRDPSIGLVGPVTNFVGNEAKIPVTYRTWSQMEHFAAERARVYDGLEADISMLAMFCVALRRDTFENIGTLDERFGIGMFEDDDYALRLREKGYRVICAADTFVHHVGQAAFKTLIDQDTYDRLFAANRAAYEDKWGARWVPHQNTTLTFRPARR